MKMKSKINFERSWVICCFFNFLIASTMGLLIRFVYLFPIDWVNYSFLLHAHSHVAMLGWVYLMIYVLVVHFFIPKEKNRKPIYNQLFWLTEFTVIGMMISFPMQGYGLFSIVFSTMHILLSYVFCRLVWKDCIKDKTTQKTLFLTAILFMVFSTLGVWCLGPAINTLGKQSAFYQIAIQFFLHFQFNGWFIFAVLALFLHQFKNKINLQYFRIFLMLSVIATFLTVAFPISWYLENSILNYINTFGVVLQLIAFIYFYKMIKPRINQFKEKIDSTTKMVYSLAFCSLFFKIGIQLVVIFPDLAAISHTIRNLVIGFIHLTTLGVITGFLFGVLIQHKLLSSQSRLLRLGIKGFIFGYIATEFLLFIQGGLFYTGKGKLFGYFEGVFLASFFIVIGLVLIVISILNKKQESIT
ncbi:hypothetical protein AR687_19555 [Flavobacteriaceae bacterium CRH]|nr:hypothetical protein AR687_19555 [Flavobacteriaceae bacterium CRH]